MKAIVINDNNREFIGVVAYYPWAIDFLIQKDYLSEDSQVWINHQSFLLKEVFPNWQEEIKSWDIEKFNKFFNDDFYLEAVELYGVKY